MSIPLSVGLLVLAGLCEIGGMVSSTILTLLVIPVLYAMWWGREVNRRQHSGTGCAFSSRTGEGGLAFFASERFFRAVAKGNEV